jgi:hypothetical protein
MFRKTVLAIAAVATISAAALVPTSASAKGFKGWWGGKYWGYGVGLAIAAPLAYSYSCWRWVETPYGLRRVNVCY